MNENPHFFPIRHLSPVGSFHLIKFLDKINPRIVLIEGPSDVIDELNYMVGKNIVLPIAIFAYSDIKEAQSVLYPLASYSSEYQAIKWAKLNKKEVRFIDLPTNIVLGISQKDEDNIEDENNYISVRNVFKMLDGDEDYDSFWERNFERNLNDDYLDNILKYGESIRNYTYYSNNKKENAKNQVREAYMKYQIQKAQKEGYNFEQMVVVTGAYHTSALMDKKVLAMTDDEVNMLPSLDSSFTLMPYTYYRLSEISGYGAGNKAPYYYEMMWKCINDMDLDKLAYEYVVNVADAMRKSGQIPSSAQVIDAICLAFALAKIKLKVPTLKDLKDGIIATLGEGNYSKVVDAFVKVDIGTKIGFIPQEIIKTPIQKDFYSILKKLKLEKYMTIEQNNIVLDIRENRRVKNEEAKFLDLNRSYFLNMLNILGVHLGKEIYNYKNASWKEEWKLAFSTEIEIKVIENSHYGNSIYSATKYILEKNLKECANINEATQILQQCYGSGILEALKYATEKVEEISVLNSSFEDMATACFELCNIVSFGSIRQIDTEFIKPIIQKLFFRSILNIESACYCNEDASHEIESAIDMIDKVSRIYFELVDVNTYKDILLKLYTKMDINSRLAGIIISILLENNYISSEKVINQVEIRLSKGAAVDCGILWFEGLVSRNKYVILSKIDIWEKLDEYIMLLDGEELKKTIVFLHRAFRNFSSKERYILSENLANIWGIEKNCLEEYLNDGLSEKDEIMLNSLQDFNF